MALSPWAILWWVRVRVHFAHRLYATVYKIQINPQNQIKILKFLSESNNGRCTYAEFKRFDNDPPHHLATFLLNLIFTGKVQDNTGIDEYILTDEGKKYLVELQTLSVLSKSVSQKSK